MSSNTDLKKLSLNTMLLAFMVVFWDVSGAASGEQAVCGFHQHAQRYEQARQTGTSARVVTRDLAKVPLNGTCEYSDLYDSVFSIETDEYVLFYTLSGPHKVRDYEKGHNSEFVAAYAEEIAKAWDKNVNTIGMKSPESDSISYVFRQPVPKGKYAIEIVDIGLGREEGLYCRKCYGLALGSDNIGSGKSTLLVENDFLIRSTSFSMVRIDPDDPNSCTYPAPEDTLTNADDGSNYYDKWLEPLQSTAHHELYHGFQLQYEDHRAENSYHFWWEASATGMEADGAPESNDYYQYLHRTIENTKTSMYEEYTRVYGQAPFFLYLHSQVDSAFDRHFWEYRQDLPDWQKDIHATFTNVLRNDFSLALDTVYHEYALAMSMSGLGERVRESDLFYEDLWEWPSHTLDQLVTGQKLEACSNKYGFGANDSMVYQFYDISASFDRRDVDQDDLEALLNWNTFKKDPSKNVSFIKFTSKYLKQYPFATPETVPPLEEDEEYRLLISSTTPPDCGGPDSIGMVLGAFPNPYEFDGPLCFALDNFELTSKTQKRHIKILNAAGNVVQSLEAIANPTCWDARTAAGPKFRPGLYYYLLPGEKRLRKLIILR